MRRSCTQPVQYGYVNLGTGADDDGDYTFASLVRKQHRLKGCVRGKLLGGRDSFLEESNGYKMLDI